MSIIANPTPAYDEALYRMHCKLRDARLTAYRMYYQGKDALACDIFRSLAEQFDEIGMPMSAAVMRRCAAGDIRFDARKRVT
jgi:hypothetical protein